MKYVLEPMLFAFDQDLTKQELIDYLAELQELDEWWDSHRQEMYIQDSTNDALGDNNYYPMAGTLKPLMEKHGIDFIQYGDVNRIIEKMLTKSEMIESLFDELCEVRKQDLSKPMAVKPGVKRSEILDSELMKLLGNVFLAYKNGGYDEKSFVVITKGVSDIVSMEYEYVEIDEDCELVEKTGKQAVNCKASLTEFLNDDKTPFYLWKTAERKEDLDLGVRVSVLQLNEEPNIACVYANYNFLLQDSFYQDYCEGHYKSKDSDIRSTIQSVTDAVTDNNLHKMHAIRTGPKGNNPQLTIQGYDALRRDITTSIKLAYWKKGREYKIANMREHDFFEPSWE